MATIAWHDDITDIDSPPTAGNSSGGNFVNFAEGDYAHASVIGAFTTVDWTWTWEGNPYPEQPSDPPVALPAFNQGTLPKMELVFYTSAVREAGRITVTAIVDGVVSNTLELYTTGGAGPDYPMKWGEAPPIPPVPCHSVAWHSPIRDPVCNKTYSNNGTEVASSGVGKYVFGVSDLNYATVTYSTTWTPATPGDPTALYAITETYVDYTVYVNTDRPGILRFEVLVDGVPAANSLYLEISAGRSVHWYPSEPTVDFSGTPLIGYAPMSVAFTDLSAEPTSTSRTWVFGDGGTSTLATPTYIYGVPGVYTVTMDATRCVYGSELVSKEAYVTVLEPLPGYIPGNAPEDTTSGYTMTPKPRPRYFPG